MSSAAKSTPPKATGKAKVPTLNASGEVRKTRSVKPNLVVGEGMSVAPVKVAGAKKTVIKSKENAPAARAALPAQKVPTPPKSGSKPTPVPTPAAVKARSMLNPAEATGKPTSHAQQKASAGVRTPAKSAAKPTPAPVKDTPTPQARGTPQTKGMPQPVVPQVHAKHSHLPARKAASPAKPSATPVQDELAKARKVNPAIPKSTSAMHRNLEKNMPAHTGLPRTPGPGPIQSAKKWVDSRKAPPSPPTKSIWQSYKSLSRRQAVVFTAGFAAFAVAGLYGADYYEDNYLKPGVKPAETVVAPSSSSSS